MPIASSVRVIPADKRDHVYQSWLGAIHAFTNQVHCCRTQRLLSIAVTWTVCLAGCCGEILTSARYATPVSGPAAVSTAAMPVAPADVATTGDAGCVVPSEGYCGSGRLSTTGRLARRSVGALPRSALPSPRAAGQLEAEADVEAELYPPHSRFPPVPTAPVFAQRQDYEPPQRMMEPTPAPPRFAPQALPHVPNVQPLPTPVAPGPEIGPVPTNPPAGDAAPRTDPAWTTAGREGQS